MVERRSKGTALTSTVLPMRSFVMYGSFPACPWRRNGFWMRSAEGDERLYDGAEDGDAPSAAGSGTAAAPPPPPPLALGTGGGFIMAARAHVRGTAVMWKREQRNSLSKTTQVHSSTATTGVKLVPQLCPY
jgi:hypothetical protein